MSKETVTPNDKKQYFMQALIDEYGNNTVIDKSEMLKVYKKKTRTKAMKSKMPHTVSITRDKDLKLERNRYLVTDSEDPKSVKDAIIATQKALGCDHIRTTAQATK